MGTVRQRRATRNPQKNTRRVAEKHRSRVTIHGNSIIKNNWNKKLTLKQNYEKLGLLASLNTQTGGKERNSTQDKSQTKEGASSSEPKDLKEITDADVEEIKKSLAPGEGLIQRDDEGNIIRIIVGENKLHDDILDTEFAPAEAKTDVVRQLEEQAANAAVTIKYTSEFQLDWIQKLINKYGTDYKAMFWDKELNEQQLTANQLKKKCEKYIE